MHDPFPLAPPAFLLPYVEPLAAKLSLPTLPLHYHEVIFAFALYHITNTTISPIISRTLFPRIYPAFNARTKLNWDVHVVSFVQSVVICGLALWVQFSDAERAAFNTSERVYGYTGAGGLIQAFAGGYFLWDLVITVQNVRIFGVGMLAHAVSALCVFSLGFRPFVNYYGPSFILYELSSPFLNIHWFCDKLNMTGSRLQFVNGLILLLTFFSCRLVWGTYQSVRVYADVYRAFVSGPIVLSDPVTGKLHNGTVVGNAAFNNNALRFAQGQTVPVWLAGVYMLSNITLNGLNWFWFGKMIETLRKRFDPPLGTRRSEVKEPQHIPEDKKVLIEGIHVATPAAREVEELDYLGDAGVEVKKTGAHLEVGKSEVKSRVGTRRRG